MKRHIGTLSAIALFLSVGLANAAGQATGKIKEINEAERTMVLYDGTKFEVYQAVSLEGLSPGKEVSVSYAQDGDRKIANEIRASEKQ